MGNILWLFAVLFCSGNALPQPACLSSQVCGDVRAPYPFSFSPDCGHPNFTLACSNSMPFFDSKFHRVPVLNITWSTLVVAASGLAANTCDVSVVHFELFTPSPYAMSSRNEFFTAGCNAEGNLTFDPVGADLTATSTNGCQTTCFKRPPSDRYLFCESFDCCVNPISGGARSVTMRVDNNETKDSCSIANMIYPPSYRSSKSYGIELSWAIPVQSCTNLCSDGAICITADFLPGKVCKCPDQFTGDGYTNGTGCTAIRHCPGGVYSDGHCKIKTTAMTLGILAAAGVSVMLLIAWILFTVKAVPKGHRTMKGVRQLRRKFKQNARFFTYKELSKATENFKSTRKLGTGSYGSVFQGTLDNQMIAIKKANNASRPRMQQFLNEVTILSQVNHRNLVKLLGCCIEREVPLLVFEYIPNGTLFEHLQLLGGRKEALTWGTRLRIAIETAEALAYLHSAADPPIYHRDVKSLNILLDENLVAKVADFGISKLVSLESTHVSTTIHGTPGYIDPQYQQTYQLTAKSDVYSFGVVLLELVTGQRPVDLSRDSFDKNLSSFSIPFINSSTCQSIIDPRMDISEPEIVESIECTAKLAATCLSFDRENRPSMKEVLEDLKKCRM